MKQDNSLLKLVFPMKNAGHSKELVSWILAQVNLIMYAK